MKSATAVMIAAAIAAVTILTAPSAPVATGPLPQAQDGAHASLRETPLALSRLRRHAPYGERKIRLVTLKRPRD